MKLISRDRLVFLKEVRMLTHGGSASRYLASGWDGDFADAFFEVEDADGLCAFAGGLFGFDGDESRRKDDLAGAFFKIEDADDLTLAFFDVCDLELDRFGCLLAGACPNGGKCD